MARFYVERLPKPDVDGQEWAVFDREWLTPDGKPSQCAVFSSESWAIESCEQVNHRHAAAMAVKGGKS
jgi:hypothetical protein